MAKIVLLSLPAYGHVNPQLPVVAELVRRGHSLTVFNEASFGPLIRRTGADFVAYPPVLSVADLARVLHDGDLMRWLALILGSSGPLLRGILPELRRNRPDLLLFDGVAVWGEMAATNLRLPSVSIATSFIFEVFRGLEGGGEFWRYMRSFWLLFPNLVAAWVRMNAAAGTRSLPWRMPLMPRQGTVVTLVLTSKAIHPKTPKLESPRFAFVGSSIERSTRSETFDFSRLDGRPLVYVSLGTLHFGNQGFFDRAMEALADLPVQVVLSAGRGNDLSRFAHAPANFIIAEAVPQLDILERSALFLTHAGLNSMHEALWFGVPMVAVPQQFEQLRNARSIEAAGAALVLDDQCYGRPVTTAALRKAVDAVMADPGYRDRARALGQSLREAGGYQEAADRIETALAGGPTTKPRLLSIKHAA
jgi:MGT family glycosyltransferase